MTRREAREAVFTLLFETEFRPDEDCAALFALSCEEREIVPNAYMKNAFAGTIAHKADIDEKISAHARGWRPERLTRVSRCILRLAIYEMVYCPDIPLDVSLNEAIELSKKYEDAKARPFINGILNGVKKELEAGTETSEAAPESHD